MKQSSELYDVAIVGGGMVGSAAAVGLAQLGLHVALLESHMPQAYCPQQPPDLRVSAINLASQGLLQSLGAWPFIEAMRYQPYRRLAVWEDQGHCEFSADELGMERLGYFVENRLMQLALHQCAEKLPNLDIISQRQIKLGDCELKSPCVLSFSDGTCLRSKWLVAADGAQSSLRQLANIATSAWPYAQQVLAITVRAPHSAHDITWQQFSPSGPMAFLPLYQDYAELIWYHSAERVAELKAMPFAELKQQIQACFPQQLGAIEVLDCASFPIQRLHAKPYYHQQMLLIGDAAHCINPLAGQGVNLGFKDVAALLSLIEKQESIDTAADIQQVFRQFQAQRRPDNTLMMSAMDILYFGFSNNIAPLRKIRNFGMDLASKLTFVKKRALKYAAGVASEL